MPCWTRWDSTTTNWPIISPNVHRHHHHHHHPRLREGAVDPGPEAEAGDAEGCHPEGVAGTTTTMEAARWRGRRRRRGTSWPWPWAWAWPRHPPSTSAHESRRIAASDGSVGRRCPSTLRGAPHHAYQYHHHGLQGWRRTRSLSHVLAFVHPQHGLKRHGDVLGRSNARMPRRKRCPRRRRSQRGGLSPALITGIFKTAYNTIKAIGEHQQKRAKKISAKRRREVDESYARGKPKKYAGESFNCCIM